MTKKKNAKPANDTPLRSQTATRKLACNRRPNPPKLGGATSNSVAHFKDDRQRTLRCCRFQGQSILLF